MTDWIQIIYNLKEERFENLDYETAAQYRDIEKWLKFNHSIEEIFENKDSYCEIVKKELLKLERRKKIDKINGNYSISDSKYLEDWTKLISKTKIQRLKEERIKKLNKINAKIK